MDKYFHLLKEGTKCFKTATFIIYQLLLRLKNININKAEGIMDLRLHSRHTFTTEP